MNRVIFRAQVHEEFNLCPFSHISKITKRIVKSLTIYTHISLLMIFLSLANRHTINIIQLKLLYGTFMIIPLK